MFSTHLPYSIIGLCYTFPEICRLLPSSQSARLPRVKVAAWYGGCRRQNIVNSLCRSLKLQTVYTFIEMPTQFKIGIYYPGSFHTTWIACTSRLLSSRAAEAVEVPKDAAPLCKPRIMRPSFLYCSIGSQKRSRTPWTEKEQAMPDLLLLHAILWHPLYCRHMAHCTWNHYYQHGQSLLCLYIWQVIDITESL